MACPDCQRTPPSASASDEGSSLMVKNLDVSVVEHVDEPSRRRCGVWPLFWVCLAVAAVALARRAVHSYNRTHYIDLPNHKKLNVAFVGNSMLYFNDFPRLFSVFSGDRIYQNSVLHGGGSIPSLLIEGNSMYPQFETGNAVLERKNNHTIYDYGACTIMQLMMGTDDRLDDPGYAQTVNDESNSSPAEQQHFNHNPCRVDPEYLEWSKQYFAEHTPEVWDVVLINDNTRDPARARSRARSVAFLEQFWVPLLQAKGATPIFLWTQAYSVESTASRNMTGLDDVANFTSLTYVGLKAYVDVLAPHFPESQRPRIAPVGLAYLMVYEERPELWLKLFHQADHIHASPLGSFLQACVVHYTVFDETMPDHDFVVRRDPASLWKTARMMQHAWDPANPFPTQEEAAYLYNVAERILVHGQRPKSFIDYQNGEVADEGGRGRRMKQAA